MTAARPLSKDELELLHVVRGRRKASRGGHGKSQITLGERVSDRVASLVGSWRFIIVQSTILVIWMALNVVGWMAHWDPYPFILLNLVLSFQAAYTAPIIMMSQNRQAAIDRQSAAHDYDVNLKAELEIELLHHKIDLMREHEIARLIDCVTRLEAQLLQAPVPSSASKP
jgi:uncharacterized membrane protein